ncbi:MAG: PrsW family glutamic-type intramembrane protease [Verrucomicrobiota bacterium]
MVGILSSAQLFYLISPFLWDGCVLINDQRQGPYTAAELHDRVSRGVISPSSLIWCDGLVEWTRFSDYFVQEPNLGESPRIPSDQDQVKGGNIENAPRAPAAPPQSIHGSIKTPPPVSSEQDKSILTNVFSFICSFCGLAPVQGFDLSHFFSETLVRRTSGEVDVYFNCGCIQNTPNIADVSSEWPKPWFFLRMLIFGLITLVGFCLGLEFFNNPKMIPGLIIVGAFFVPLTCVSLFFEINVVRNISLYQLIKLIVGGGIVSIVIALFLFAVTDLHQTFLGATSAGVVEEIAKVLAAVFIVRSAAQYKWILNGLLVGAAVGAGFAGFESAGYMFEALLGGLSSNEGLGAFYQTLFVRAVFAPFCHVVWTASVVGGLWRVKGDLPFHFNMLLHKDFLRILAFVVLLHMLWNSGMLWVTPTNANVFKGQIYFWVTSIVGSWYLVFLLVEEGLRQIETVKQKASLE